VSDDWAPPPLTAAEAAESKRRPTVHWRNLASKNLLGQTGVARFFAPPQLADLRPPRIRHDRRWMIPGADHQLVSLPNGDVVYQILTASREPIQALWFASTSRNLLVKPGADGVMPQFGPGARSTLATWISTDCGESFRYATEIDSFGSGYEECANPQPKDPCPTCTVPPLPLDMGGTDGPSLVVDRATGRLYAIFQCVGRKLEVDASGTPSLAADGIGRTYVFSSDDGGRSFDKRGFLTPAVWGPQAVALSKGRLAVGIGTGLVIATRNSATGGLDFPTLGLAVQDANAQWRFPPGSDLERRMAVYSRGNTLLAPAPGNGERLIFGFPSLVEKTKGNSSTLTQGFRLFLYDPAVLDPSAPGAFAELPEAIVPAGSPANSAVLHVTAVVAEPGGPILLYWTDLDGATNTARVRGRILHEGAFTGGKSFQDFDIALAAGAVAPFVLTEPGTDPSTEQDLSAYFYGDYRTAGAFRDPDISQTPTLTVSTYRFYPVWVQPWTQELSGNAPGGSVRFTEVTVTKSTFRAQASEPLTQKEPDLIVGGECCDFGPLFERAALSREGRSVRSALLSADSRLSDPRLRVRMQPARTPERVQTILVHPMLPPAMRAMFESHRRNRVREDH
jgi:hypothetical protein